MSITSLLSMSSEGANLQKNIENINNYGVTITDVATRIGITKIHELAASSADFNNNNFGFKNISKLLLGGATFSDYKLEVKNVSTIANFTGTTKGAVNLEGAYTADYYNCIDFSYDAGSAPSSRIAAQFTSSGSLIHFGVTDAYGSGITKTPLKLYNAGLIVADSILFTTNNIGAIGSGSIAPANIYSVNALNVTSDNNEKKDINKVLPLGLNFINSVAKNAIGTYKWKNTVIPEKKAFNLKKTIKINQEGKEEIEYKTEEIVIQKASVETHKRTHFGFLGVELFEEIQKANLNTKDCAFLSVEKDGLDDKDNVIIENNRPKGKITLKPMEMLPILFKAISELTEMVENQQKEIENLKENVKNV